VLLLCDEVARAIHDFVPVNQVRGFGSVHELYRLLLSAAPEVQRTAYHLLRRMVVEENTVRSIVLHGQSQAQEQRDNVNIEHELEEEGAREQEQGPHLDALLPANLRKILEDESLSQPPAPPTSPSKTSESASFEHRRMGYFLAWWVLMEDIGSSGPSQRRSDIGQYVRRQNIFGRFLSALFHHIQLSNPSATANAPAPSVPILSVEKTSTAVLGIGVQGAGTGTGTGTGGEDGDRDPFALGLSGFAGVLYVKSLQTLPALVRLWFNSECDRSTTAQIEKYTTQYAVPQLLVREIKSISQAQAASQFGSNMQVKASRVSREVVATYFKDDAALEIVIRLPPTYPLRSVNVECTRRLGISEGMWRKWMLSMTTLLSTQDGSLLDAVLMWKENVDKQFEGVEECPICYQILHLGNHSLPRLACRTCRHKFHSACLYKWFSTSHKSNCPLCQSPF